MTFPATRLRPASLQLYRPGSHLFNARCPLISRRTFVYPKEGIFQPNSPPHDALRDRLEQQQRSRLPPSSTPQPGPQGNNRRGRRWFSTVLFATAGLAFGINTVLKLKKTFSPDAPIIPGSPEDHIEMTRLEKELHDLPQYQMLLHDPEWRMWPAYSSMQDDRREKRLTTGPLSGTGGLAAQYIFWNETQKAVIVFVNFGNSTCGFPGFVHGGAVATVCDESLGRVAIRTFEEKTGVTANLEMSYLAPICPKRWYVLSASLDPARWSTDKKKYIHGAITDADQFWFGKWMVSSRVKPNVIARGLFVVPKGIQLSAIEEDF